MAVFFTSVCILLQSIIALVIIVVLFAILHKINEHPIGTLAIILASIMIVVYSVTMDSFDEAALFAIFDWIVDSNNDIIDFLSKFIPIL
jgi:hypothetical protein